MHYVSQNASRIIRALFEVCLSRNWGSLAAKLLALCKSVDKRIWSFEHPLLQFDFQYQTIDKLGNAPKAMTVEAMRDMTPSEIGNLIRFQKEGHRLYRASHSFPTLKLSAEVHPLTRTILRIILTIECGKSI